MIFFTLHSVEKINISTRHCIEKIKFYTLLLKVLFGWKVHHNCEVGHHLAWKNNILLMFTVYYNQWNFYYYTYTKIDQIE